MYGMTDLVGNFRQGVSSLTQIFASGVSQSNQLTENQQLHTKLSMWIKSMHT